GAVLGQSLKPEVTAQDVLRFPLPALADVAALVTLKPDGRPGKASWGRFGADGFSLREAGEWPDPAQAEPELTAAVERARAGVPVSETGPAIALPLRARGHTFAVLGLSRKASGRVFTP